MPDHPRLDVVSAGQWRAWLQEHHDSARGVWLVLFKKASGGPYVPWGELVDEALCFGWIDSRRRSVDDRRSSQLMTPRKPGSAWSAINKDKVARLEAEGRMAPAGLAMVELAKRTGTWTAMDAVEALVEPDDLRAALDADPAARAGFDAYPPSARKLALYQVVSAKRPQTRARRIAEAVARAARGERP